MNYYVCNSCGHVEFHFSPEVCPICHSEKEKFNLQNDVFSESKENTPNGEEKHVSVLEIKGGEENAGKMISIKIGKTLHPSDEDHHIIFADSYLDDKFVSRIYFSDKVSPVSYLCVKKDFAKISVVSFCNIHGWWLGEKQI